ncbi:uncharacterized protein N7484_008983 [Penicillium longicatenatum]|uniref:uncharacterized protein n=1 Tax=Penicillium longicatenatum TaxID=1561947 RepID=UPI002548801A|nr:uncharacterized protein N7484_008983 [Penicillium longicatenatum]KAJ5635670.1 hypothetical protein N7484_008983 [Penicillium longicatenatum]
MRFLAQTTGAIFTLLTTTSATTIPQFKSEVPQPNHTHEHAKESRLWATHYNGHVYTLTLSGSNLSIADTQKTCGAMPSWLTFDSESKILYCSDEDGTSDPSTHGSLTAYRVDGHGGKLAQIAKTKTVGGGVNSVIFEAGKKDKYIAIAHYEGSAISTFALPLKSNSEAKQTLPFNMTHQGAVAQQDSPHPHEVFLDPTGSFLVSPDLGADLLRIYSIDATTGHLGLCPPVNVTFGSGPRHGVFWTDDPNKNANAQNGASTHMRQAAAVGKTMMYLVNEIGGTMMSFDVSYARSGCLDLAKTQTLVPYPGGKMPEGATPAEIRMVGEKFYVSIRSDQGFKPDDSIVTLDRHGNGTVVLKGKSDAYGKVPRTMVINRKGDLVAIGDQSTSTVAIVQRDHKTGHLGKKIADLQVGEPGKVGTAEGLSSVIWED